MFKFFGGKKETPAPEAVSREQETSAVVEEEKTGFFSP